MIESDHSARGLTARLQELSTLIEPVQGWLHCKAGRELYRHARFNVPTATIVEIGSWKGRSTAWLGFAAKDRGEGEVYAIDTWLGSPEHQESLKDYQPGQLREEFLENMRRLDLQSVVQAIESDSISAARTWPLDKPIGLLFIDGTHDYSSVRNDFEFWSPLLAPDGVVIFDDVHWWPGPLQAAHELPRWFELAGASVNLIAFRKVMNPYSRSKI